MRNQLLLFLVALLPLFLVAQPPTTPSTNLNFNSITGGNARLLATPGDGSRRIAVIRQGSPVTGIPQDGFDYNPDNQFGDGDEIAPGEYVIFDVTTFSFTTIQNLAPATTYHVAIFEYNGSGQDTEYLTTALTGSFTTLSQPTQNASNPMTSEITGNSALISWTPGNGDGRLVVLREGGPVSANPVNLENYSARTRFGDGGEITPGNFVLYSQGGTLNSFTVSLLEPGKTYHGAIFEWNGAGGKVYAVPGVTFQFTTELRPDVGSTLLQLVGTSEGNGQQFRYLGGNGNGRIGIIRAGTDLTGVVLPDNVIPAPDRDFGDGDEVAPGAFAFFRSNFRNFGAGLSTVDVTSLLPNTTYTIGIYEFNRSNDESEVYFEADPVETLTFTSATAPTVQASSPSVTENVGITARLNWTRGNGNGSFVVMKAGSAVDFDPSDLVSYGTSTFFGQREVGTENYGITRGAINTTLVRDLVPGTEYHVAIWEYNGNSGPVYTRPPLRFSFTAPLTPSVSATNLNFTDIEGDRFRVGFNVGNGAKRLIVARQGMPVTAEPVDGQTYVDGSIPFGMGTELSPGEFVVYGGNSNGGNGAPYVTGMTFGTEYHFAIFEFNEDAGGGTFYRRTDPGRGSQSTAVIPTVSSPALSTQNLNAVSVTLDHQPGDGDRRFLVMKADGPVDFVPAQLIRYSQSTRFGIAPLPNGTGNMGVTYTSFGNTTNVTEILPNTTYHVASFEVNGNNQPVYNLTPTRLTFTTPRYPTEAPTSFVDRTVGATQITAQLFRGNGSSRIIVARLAGTPAVAPLDDQEYNADPTYGQGDDLGGGNFVVARESLYRPNNLYIFTVDGLNSGTDYVFTAYEVASSPTNTYYRAPGTDLNTRTVGRPTTDPVNLQVNDILAESATIAWTTGDGEGEYILMSENVPVSQLVADGDYFGASSAWTANTPVFGNARPVYFGSNTEVNLTRLTPGTVYHVQAQAYNGTSTSPAYLQSAATVSFRTPGAPSLQATNARVTSVEATRLSLAWDKGNGTDRIVLAKKDGPVDAFPQDGNNYLPNTFFGSGDEIGMGNFVIASGDFDTVSVTNLMLGCTYHFAVFEYNVDQSRLYNITMPAVASSETVLPVNWSYFRGSLEGKGTAVLRWGTALEQNAAYFAVERAGEDRHFTEVGRVSANGAGDYAFYDDGLAAGRYAYRLRQVDLDGAFAFSDVLTLQVEGGDVLSVYPNPVADQLYVQGAAAGAKFALRSSDGTVVRSGLLPAGGLAVDQLKPGIYLLTVGEESLRIVVGR